MGSRLFSTLCFSALCLQAAVTPVQASETRVQPITLTCDGTARTVVFLMTNLGASTSRFIQGGVLALTEPRGGVEFMRLEAAGDDAKIIVDMGFHKISAHAHLQGFVQVGTNASGTVPMQVTGACTGGGSLTGFAVVYIFS